MKLVIVNVSGRTALESGPEAGAVPVLDAVGAGGLLIDAVLVGAGETEAAGLVPAAGEVLEPAPSHTDGPGIW